jgi:16S rRNA (guanine527-N7)-methyltransferase
MTEKQFIEKLAQEGIVLSERQIQQFADYARLLVEWNEKMNLTAITALEEIYEKHFYDCLLLHRLVKLEGSLCDVGAGAGFPSIPCKIAFPELQVTIIEPLGKRCVFLRELCKELQLENVTILNERAEDVAKNSMQRYDIVTARAVANLRVLSELCVPLVKVNGYFATMKGANGLEEKQDATKAMNILGAKFEKEDIVCLSDGANRVNLLYKKVKDTAKGYPRMFAKIKKNPL